MTQSEVEAFVASLANVQRLDSFGYAMYFVGDDHRIPFVTLADSDNEYDNVSNLNREGIYRINIGIRKATFQNLLGPQIADTVDYSAINVFLPHPHYSAQHFICILNPSGENAETTKKLISEAQAIAAERFARREEVKK